MPIQEPLPTQSASYRDEDSLERRRALAPFIVPALLLLLAAAYGFWRLVLYPGSPQCAIDRFVEAAKAKDYEGLYSLVHVTGTLKALVPNGQELRDIAKRSPMIFPQVVDHRVYNVTITGDSAVAETEVAIRGRQRVFSASWNVRLIRVGGQWKIDGQWMLTEFVRRGIGSILDAVGF